MRRSKFYNMRLPERGAREGEANDAADIEDLTYDLGIIDAEMERQRLEDVRLEKDKATKLEMSQHKSAAVLDHPDGSVTDAKLGQRTVLTARGTLQELLTAIGSAVKAATGTDTWNAAPATTLKAAKAHMDSKANPHAVTKAQVGLANADNTSDADKPVSTAQAAAIKAVQDGVTAHKNNQSNPHAVTKTQVGLGSVPNVATNDQTPTYTAASSPAALTSGETLSAAFAKLAAAVTALIAHLADATKHITAAERTKWNGAAGAQHAHANKALLDTYTQTEANLASAVSAKHTHANKSVLDGIAASLVSNWNAAYSHSSDAVKHVAAAERSLWNTVNGKLPLAGGTLTGFLTLHAAPTASLHAATKQYVDDKMAASGSGDMLKSVYDPDEDGVVDKAAAVAWSGVTGKPSAYTPAAHTHTKSQITDFPSALKNPAALTISLDGKSQGAYDGSAAKSVNITPASINAMSKAVFAHVANPNLLANSDLAHPINQRLATGTISAPGYFIDRWKLVSGTAKLTDSGIVLNGVMEQILETAAGSVFSASASAGTASYDNSTKKFRLTGTGQTIAWAKLEKSTTPTPWVPRTAGEELAECMRFYQRTSVYVSTMVQQSAEYAERIPVPMTTMRIVPTVTVKKGYGPDASAIAIARSGVSLVFFVNSGTYIDGQYTVELSSDL